MNTVAVTRCAPVSARDARHETAHIRVTRVAWSDAYDAILEFLYFEKLVGARGFEPPTTCTPCRYATRLRYAPRRELYNRETAFPNAADSGAELIDDAF